jgi:methionyl-tRNA formyltransferase
MGTGPFAIPSFDAIANSDDEVIAVITKPYSLDKKAPVNPVAQWALSRELRIETPIDMRAPEAIAMLRDLHVDLAVVCDYGQILNLEALTAPRLGAINLHGSLLPKHRGAAPIQWSLLLGDRVTGVSVIRMTTGLDSGPVLTMAETEIGIGENAVELEHRLSELGIQSTLDAIEMIRPCKSIDEVKLLGTKQDASQSTKAARLNKSDGQLDFRLSSSVLDRIIRAMQPWPGAFAELMLTDGKSLRIAIHRAKKIDVPTNWDIGRIKPGTLAMWSSLQKTPPDLASQCNVMDLHPQSLIVVTDDGLLQIEQLQPAGKRILAAHEFTAGYGNKLPLTFSYPQQTTLFC